MNSTWIDHYREGTVFMAEANDGNASYPSYFVVMNPGRYRVRLFPDPKTETFSVGFDAEWSDETPGDLANYTPSYETGGGDGCRAGEVTISDDGLLSVLPRVRGYRTPAHVMFRVGWTAQLPIEAVEPIRRAIALVEAMLLTSANEASAA